MIGGSRTEGSKLADGLSRYAAWLCLCGLGMVVAFGGMVRAQEPVSAEPVTTLHVYTDLVQIPVLVLQNNLQPIRRLSPLGFQVSLDSGPRFKPVHNRREGDDPIALSIVLDVSTARPDLLPNLDNAIAALAPGMLHPQDHVSVYVLDCDLISFSGQPAADRKELKAAVDTVMQSWTSRGQDRQGRNCAQTLHLWDALALVADNLYNEPGRRVMLVVSDGVDQGSTRTWNQLRGVAQARGVAIFGISYRTDDPLNRSLRHVFVENDPFHTVCELTGGVVFNASRGDVAKKLKVFVETVRNHYIIEFPRPSNGTAGQHSIEVTVAGTDDFVRATGIAVPVRDAALLRNPSTVPSDSSLEPTMGTRRILTPPR